MASVNGASSNFVPEQLFHTVLQVIDYSHDASGANRTTFVLKTHGTLEAAKKFAVHSLESINFTSSDFQQYQIRGDRAPSESWSHGDGVLLFARAFDGQEFLVGIDTTPNNEGVAANPDGDLVLPEGAKFLHYVLQISVDYNADRSGSLQTTEILGVYVHRADAWTAAYKCLDPTQYAEYDRRGDSQFIGEWPFGEDIAVHAVSETGQNYFIAVKNPPEKKHELKHHNLKK
ncbi:uncharacterized protein TrAFT101_001069 [Trichoderma asperellum]|uniref:Uncharacterized protein n=1 Tax=Trichoderma asperellum (strain ATCC 204424 / CBS 433.97 / NBRC 101777) TaxID=1042311 RepID=A0A2T3ZLE9_TRIA4|nr:hypothetical protein M441DRAFT_54676 [Trichoderma asperellum CBS 433.97]PTB45635.1 hypothetical protein M441DRAFT_54676 [Trichoderma asperellum CBS 433.97]UKZ85201.1 hypothetical protein TrAFT101_001069 [Trichoderma asperellum]